MCTRFWVIGGEYTDTGFTELVTGTEQVKGPFPSRETALQVWQDLAVATRSNCHARFSIAEEPGR